ncbi:MAG: peptidoglycan-binding protein [Deltaproteobacteria bacterium]|nr:peptidoglycan-binding protein [Deltaproteobacteria bacterium]
MKQSTTQQLALALVIVAVAFGCNADPEARARQAAEKVKESIPDVEAKALAQKLSADEVHSAQQALIIAKEYLGEATGKLDSVTVNAIEAFQRSHGITDDGMLNDATKKALQAQLAQK